MTLLPLALGFLAVAVLFVAVGWISGLRNRGNAARLVAEALCLTLLASLWFSSLGHGGWVLVFLLLGLLSSASAGAHGAAAILKTTALATARYVAAGAILGLLIG